MQALGLRAQTPPAHDYCQPNPSARVTPVHRAERCEDMAVVMGPTTHGTDTCVPGMGSGTPHPERTTGATDSAASLPGSPTPARAAQRQGSPQLLRVEKEETAQLQLGRAPGPNPGTWPPQTRVPRASVAAHSKCGLGGHLPSNSGLCGSDRRTSQPEPVSGHPHPSPTSEATSCQR